MERISLSGRVAVVTGSGRSIGRAHALELARRGARVLVNDVDRAAADGVVDEIRAAGGVASASYASVADAEGGALIIAAAVEAFGSVDILVNNAGILRPGYFEDISLAEYDAVLDTHLRAAFFVTQPAWRLMKRAGYGRIVMTSSSSGMFSHQGLANYACAKAGVYGLAKALAYEGAAFGIKTNVILPYALGSMQKGHPIPDMLENRQRFVSDALQARLAGRNQPELIAHLVAYLASEACEPNGEAFSACGGRYGRVFVGIADGWLASDLSEVNAEAIAAEMPRIRDVSRQTTPMWLFEEVAAVAARL